MSSREPDADDLLCWFCPKCQTLTMVREVAPGYCIQKPRRDDCPIPLTGIPIVEAANETP